MVFACAHATESAEKQRSRRATIRRARGKRVRRLVGLGEFWLPQISGKIGTPSAAANIGPDLSETRL
jgi:hypothetical protein